MNHSEIARVGIANEEWVSRLLTNGTPDSFTPFAAHLGWDPSVHKSFNAFRLGGSSKADVCFQKFFYTSKYPEQEMISCKRLMSEDHNGFGHIHKSTIASYRKKWGFDDIVERCLNVYCGNLIVEGKRRGLYFEDKFFEPYHEYIKFFFRTNYKKVFNDLFKGTDPLTAPNYFAVTAVNEESKHLFVAPIDVVIDYAMGDNTVYFGKQEKNQNLCLGNITMYSKRSTGQLQFKMNYKPMLKELGHKFRIFHF
mgnify:FL=1|tara:strand:- start:648 stop:1403 length:756 start_codon:yes stop_codon:yes gene_type:complete